MEDPVAVSAHTLLIPYRAERPGKSEMYAEQLSARKEQLYCRNHGTRVEINGYACTLMKGVISF
jgi:predicted PhzF superfamily epimerase YddE/YHI9